MNVKNSVILACSEESVVQRWKEALGEDAIISTANSLPDLTGKLDTINPEQYFLDLKLPGLRGLTGALELIPRYPDNLCLAFSTIPIDDEGLLLLKAGARAYCNRFIAPSLLEKISHLVAAGEVWLGASIMERLIRKIEEPAFRGAGNPLTGLTGREKEIAIRVSRGTNNKTIAEELDISERTVKAHLTSIFSKTGTKDRLQLALLVKEVI